MNKNPFMMLVNAARTATEDPLQKFKFRVIIPGIPSSIGFQTVSGLSEETEVVEYDESGFPYTHKLPGKNSVGEVTMERGMFADASMQDVYKSTLQNPDFRNTFIVQLLDRFGEVQRTWKLAEAWVSSWEGSDLDASSSDVAIETITVQFEYFLD